MSSNTDEYTFIDEIKAMMLIHGDKEPRIDSACLIEDLIHSHLIKLVIKSISVGHFLHHEFWNFNIGSYFFSYIDALDLNRAIVFGPRHAAISIDNICFSIRKNRILSKRIFDYLNWKEIRKSAARQQTQNQNSLTEIDFINPLYNSEETSSDDFSEATSSPKETYIKSHNNIPSKITRIPWSLAGYLLSDLSFSDMIILPEDEKIDFRVRTRLEKADLLTQNMSKSEYLYWTECRQASYTYRRGRKFREWLTQRSATPNSNDANIISTLSDFNKESAFSSWIRNVRMNDDVVEVIGFIAYEMTYALVTKALELQNLCQNSVKSDSSCLIETALLDVKTNPQCCGPFSLNLPSEDMRVERFSPENQKNHQLSPSCLNKLRKNRSLFDLI